MFRYIDKLSDTELASLGASNSFRIGHQRQRPRIRKDFQYLIVGESGVNTDMRCSTAQNGQLRTVDVLRVTRQ